MTVSHPLVSCVMPTWNRRAFIPAAIDCFLKQTYENRELVIVDDGNEEIRDLIPEDPRIRYFFENKRRITGDKRNKVNELAAGEIICHWDDDDWSAASRIEDQVARMKKSKKPVTGYAVLLFWDVVERQAKRYVSAISGYVCGTTLCYQKEFWKVRHFRSKHSESDNDFVYPILKNIAAGTDGRHMVARIHGCHHTSPKGGIKNTVPRDQLPAEFWKNEELRLRSEKR